MTPTTDPATIAQQLCDFAKTNFVTEGTDFDINTPLTDAGIDSFALLELVLFSERNLGITVPVAQLTPAHLHSVKTLATCIAELGRTGEAAA